MITKKILKHLHAFVLGLNRKTQGLNLGDGREARVLEPYQGVTADHGRSRGSAILTEKTSALEAHGHLQGVRAVEDRAAAAATL